VHVLRQEVLPHVSVCGQPQPHHLLHPTAGNPSTGDWLMVSWRTRNPNNNRNFVLAAQIYTSSSLKIPTPSCLSYYFTPPPPPPLAPILCRLSLLCDVNTIRPIAAPGPTRVRLASSAWASTTSTPPPTPAFPRARLEPATLGLAAPVASVLPRSSTATVSGPRTRNGLRLCGGC